MDECPRHGPRWFISQQTALSSIVALSGAGALLVLVVGTLSVVTAYGWTPSTSIAAAVTSSAQLTTLLTALGLGALAAAAGGATFRRAPTKPSREATISGAALGVQAILLAALVLWFRSGDVETFARNFLELDLLGEFVPRFLRAALNTLILALAGEAIGILLGLALAVLAISSRPVLRAPVRLYINLFRGTPLLWQLSFFFFGIALGLRLNLGPYEVAILVLGLNAGAYSAEIFRAGIQSIERCAVRGRPVARDDLPGDAPARDPAAGGPARDPAADERVRDPDQGHVAGGGARPHAQPAGPDDRRPRHLPPDLQRDAVPGVGGRLPRRHAAADPARHLARAADARRAHGGGGPG